MAVLSPSILLLLLSVACLATYKYFIFPVFISPLARIPNAHWSAGFSSAWITYHRLRNDVTFVVHRAYQKHGPILRLAPNEIGVNCVDGGLRTIYAGGYEKKGWYDIFQNYGVRPMFAMNDRASHSRRKRMVSNLYGKSFLQANESLAAVQSIILDARLIQVLTELEAKGKAVELPAVLSAVTMDLICAYTLGLKNGSDFLGDLEHAHSYNLVFHELQKDFPWLQEAPLITKIMKLLRLESVFGLNILEANMFQSEDMVMEMCDRAESAVQLLEKSTEHAVAKPEDYPTVYLQLRSCLLRDLKASDPDVKDEEAIKRLRNVVASELLDHTMAGYDTAGITLTYLAWQLSKPSNLHWQDKLHAELSGAEHDLRKLDSFPVLNAVVMETLRLDVAIPGGQPRVTPANASLGPPDQVYHNLPADVRVQAQAYSLHRNADVFPDPEEWLPERWIDSSDEQKKEMLRWFWAFGSGGRMCVGSNLAMIQMKAIVKTVWTSFTTTLEFDEGMGRRGGYIAPPLAKDGKTLQVWLKKRGD